MYTDEFDSRSFVPDIFLFCIMFAAFSHSWWFEHQRDPDVNEEIIPETYLTLVPSCKLCRWNDTMLKNMDTDYYLLLANTTPLFNGRTQHLSPGLKSGKNIFQKIPLLCNSIWYSRYAPFRLVFYPHFTTLFHPFRHPVSPSQTFSP